MTNFVTSYRPSVHGFRFGNRFRHHLVLGWSTWGRCNGMAQVSIDYFRAGRPGPVIDVVDYGTYPISGVGAASSGANHVELFVRRDGDRIATKHFDGRTFSQWQDMSSWDMSMSPAAASWGPGRVDVVVRGKDGRVWHQWRDGGLLATPLAPWNGYAGVCRPLPGFENLEGQVASAPAVAAPFSDRLEIYARGLDGALWFRYWSSSWSIWSSLGKPPGIELTSDPSAASQYGWMTALVRGSDNAIWQKEWANNRWQPWRSLGGVATSAPAVASPAPGRLEAYVRGTDGQMYISIFENGHWGSWAALGAPPPGLAADKPAAVSHPGLLDVYARANDNTIWHRRWANGRWNNWESAETPVSADSRRLTDAIYARLMTSTITPILAAAAVAGPLGWAVLGSIKNYMTLRPYPNDILFAWAAGDEMQKLTRFLQAGSPIPVCLIDVGNGFGHEVVGYGGDINIGARSVIRVYDPNYPMCDDMKITIDPDRGGRIVSESGERWRALWIRDDYGAQAPPL